MGWCKNGIAVRNVGPSNFGSARVCEVQKCNIILGIALKKKKYTPTYT